MAVRARKDGRPTRNAVRIGDEAVGQSCATLRPPIKIRHLVDDAAITRQRMGGGVIAHDEEDVRSPISLPSGKVGDQHDKGEHSGGISRLHILNI